MVESRTEKYPMAKKKVPGSVYQLKITLRDIKPPIWRRVQVEDCSLFELYVVIQTCMGWGGFHLHSFNIGGQEYSEPDPDGMMDFKDESRVKLSRVLTGRIKKFLFTYDFGDNWEHLIEVEKKMEPEPGVRYPRCVAGKRACPPEDCGGVWGYAELLKALGDPNHARHEELLEWCGGNFDPERFDMEEINNRLHAR
jgi:hypothetical protein